MKTKRWLSFLLTLAMLLTMVPGAAFAREPGDLRFEATRFEDISDLAGNSSQNGQTVAAVIWKMTGDQYYLAVALAEQHSDQISDPWTLYEGDPELSIITDEGTYSKKPSDVGEKEHAKYWCIAALTREDFEDLEPSGGNYIFNLKEQPGGFQLGSITLPGDFVEEEIFKPDFDEIKDDLIVDVDCETVEDGAAQHVEEKKYYGEFDDAGLFTDDNFDIEETDVTGVWSITLTGITKSPEQQPGGGIAAFVAQFDEDTEASHTVKWEDNEWDVDDTIYTKYVNGQWVFDDDLDGDFDDDAEFDIDVECVPLKVTKELTGVTRDGVSVDPIPDFVRVGDTLTYTITVKNLGSKKLTDIKLADVLKSGDNPRDVTWSEGSDHEKFDLNSGSEMTFTVTYTVVEDDANNTLSNVAKATYTEDDKEKTVESGKIETDVDPLPDPEKPTVQDVLDKFQKKVEAAEGSTLPATAAFPFSLKDDSNDEFAGATATVSSPATTAALTANELDKNKKLEDGTYTLTEVLTDAQTTAGWALTSPLNGYTITITDGEIVVNGTAPSEGKYQFVNTYTEPVVPPTEYEVQVNYAISEDGSSFASYTYTEPAGQSNPFNKTVGENWTISIGTSESADYVAPASLKIGDKTYVYDPIKTANDLTGNVAETVTLKYGLDVLGTDDPGVPDYYQATVTFDVVNGTWNDDSDDEITKVVTLVDQEGNWSENGSYTLTADDIPSGMKPNEGFGNGSWNTDPVNAQIDKNGAAFTHSFVAETTPPERPDWDRSKSKTASELDENFESQVTLSLPSAEEELVSDIVFVVDKSTSSREESQQEGLAMLERLANSIQGTNASINVGIIVFDGTAHIMRELLPYDADDVRTKMEAEIPDNEHVSGTNIEAGLLTAQTMLESDTDVYNNRKYVILISDGLTRLFTGHDRQTVQIIFNQQYADGDTYFGDYTTWCLSNGLGDGEYRIPGNTNWFTYYTNTIKPQVEEDQDRYVVPFDGDSTKNEAPQTFIPYAEVSDHAQAVDRAFYDAYQAYLELSEEYHCYAIYTGNSDLGKGFMDTLNGNETLNFDAIQKDIYYLLSAGSEVVDVIGAGTWGGKDYNFDFIADKLKLTVNGEEQELTKIGTVDGIEKYGFGDPHGSKDETTYPYVLSHYPNGRDGSPDECLVWEINVDVSNFAPVALTYSVKLTNPQTTPGTYGQYDKDGSKNYAGLYTNKSATLYPVDSNNEPGGEEEFPKPTVSYTVNGPAEIKPADITIYMGGNGYEGAIDGNGNSLQSDNGFPIPGFQITAPDGVTDFHPEDAQLKYENGADVRLWDINPYDDVEDATHGIYRFDPAAEGSGTAVRMQFEKIGSDGNGTGEFVKQDDFTIEDFLNQTLLMEVYGESVGKEYVTLLYQGQEYPITSAFGKLTVRSTTTHEAYGDVATQLDDIETGEAGVVTGADTVYTINDSDVKVVDPSGVKLLFDDIIENNDVPDSNTDLLEDRADDILGSPDRNMIRHYESKYLDLVDTNNGNAWVAADRPITVTWPLPQGTNRNTDFELLHFIGLHREEGTSVIADQIGECEVENVKIQVTDTHITFTITESGFSPFTLVWEEKDDDDDDNDRPSRPSKPDKKPSLEKGDHYAYIVGYEDGTVRPNTNITRAEVATIFFRLLTDESREDFWSTTNDYRDTRPDAWYNNAISTMTRAGVLTGYEDLTFRPYANITRAEFATIAARFLSDPYTGRDRFSDISGHWAAEYINRAAREGWINGYPDGTFRPDQPITRAEAMTLVNAVLERAPHEDYLLDDMIVWPDNSENAWYYEAVQEATNSHDYKWYEDEDYEEWTKLLENRDWVVLEQQWAEANDSKGPEVMS